ncbi:hypothetical protein DSLASN_46470 [Desulfoluna limicola]|uniref:Uncharacterized protein n=1 Tax=Desulfoluna limicola TaxID=2810562 RepID=A0ABN6FAR4_9BACT|nr:hypothetical protein DSLASN_46470 [Desulfoluna limicola]
MSGEKDCTGEGESRLTGTGACGQQAGEGLTGWGNRTTLKGGMKESVPNSGLI